MSTALRVDDGWVSFAECRRILSGRSPQFILAAALAKKVTAKVIAGRVVFERESLFDFKNAQIAQHELCDARNPIAV